MSDPNYLTPEGAKKLQDELRQLVSVERPKVVQEVQEAAAQGDRSENAEYIYGKKRLREIDRRMRFLHKRLAAAELVEPSQDRGEVVFFGATVLTAWPDGSERTFEPVPACAHSDSSDLRIVPKRSVPALNTAGPADAPARMHTSARSSAWTNW